MGSLLALFLFAGHAIWAFFSSALVAISTGFLFALGIPFVYKHFRYQRSNNKNYIAFIITICVGFFIGRIIYAFIIMQPWFGLLIDMLTKISGLSKDNVQAIILIAILYMTVTTSHHIQSKYIQKRL
jgi:hypothetical protein